MKKNNYTRQEKYYEDYWNYRVSEGRIHTKEDMWIPKRIEVATNMITQEIKLRGNRLISVFDIGCGEGTIGKVLKENLKNEVSIIGCDISNTVLKIASAYYTKVFKIDVETEKFPEEFYTNKFDFIILLEVLEHLFKPENVLAQCHKILKENGFLIASFPNIAWYKYRIGLLKGHFPTDYLFGSGEHIQQFTLHSFIKLLQENGFSAVELDGNFIFPKIIAELLRPNKIFLPILKKFPNLFGAQLVVKAKRNND